MNRQIDLTDSQAQNRKRFFNAGMTLFTRHGYKKTTVEEICTAAKLSKPTFYKLFKDKSELFAQAVLDYTEQTVRDWQIQLPEQADPVEKINAFLDFYWDVLCKNPLMKTILEEPKIIEEFAHFLYTTPNSPIMTACQDILAEGVAGGHFRQLDPELGLYMVYSLLDSMFIFYPMMTGKPGAGDDPVTTEEVRKFILNGLGVKNG